MTGIYQAGAGVMLVVHLGWILFVIFGALFTRGRPWLTAFHIGSLIWGIIVEVGPWPCPLTLAENSFKIHAGLEPIAHSFIVHYFEQIIYPDLPVFWIVTAGVVVCGINLAIYLFRLWRRLQSARQTAA